MRVDRRIGEKDTSVPQPREWLECQMEQQREAVQSAATHDNPPVISSVALWGHKKNVLQWSVEACADRALNETPPDSIHPYAIFRIGMHLAFSLHTLQDYCRTVSEILMNDPDVWHAFIDPSPHWQVPHSGFYHNTFSRLSWERHLERQLCKNENAAGRWARRVRNVYWGNVFGAEFSHRLREAGVIERFRSLQDEAWGDSVLLQNEQTGSMAVLLDEEPVRFAIKRDAPRSDEEHLEWAKAGDFSTLTGDDIAVHCGAMLWSALSQAGLL